MKIKFNLTIWLIATLPFISFAQRETPTLTSSNIEDVRNYVSNNYNLNEKTIDTLCLYTVVFIKFKVSEKGKIEELYLTEKTPPVIKAELEKAIKSTNGHWSEAAGDKAYFSGKAFMLPVVLFYGRGCGEGNGELETNITEEQRAREYRKLNSTTRNANY
ncbi:MAG: hypothetical protein EOO93_13730, partial [Pedobacter sp.]